MLKTWKPSLPITSVLGRAVPATLFIPDAQRYTDLRSAAIVSQAYEYFI